MGGSGRDGVGRGWRGWALACGLLALGAAPSWAGTTTITHDFTGGYDGELPSGVIGDDQGNLYGVAQEGGAYGCGVIYKIHANHVFTVLKQLDQMVTGCFPNGALIRKGNILYGSTQEGLAAFSANGYGVVFSIHTDGSTFQVLHVFSGPDGAFPSGPLAVDVQGDVFGTTSAGGLQNQNPSNTYGVLFEIRPDLTFIQLHNFTDDTTGSAPDGVVVDRSGNLFGTTVDSFGAGFGGDYESVYEFVPSTAALTVLHRFSISDGQIPHLAGMNPNGNLFGWVEASYSTQPQSNGILFELEKKSSGQFDYHLLHAFAQSRTDGGDPTGLTLTGHNSLIGVTEYGPGQPGGPSGYGTIFSYANGVYGMLYAFVVGKTTSRHPVGMPALTSSGSIVGTDLNSPTSCDNFTSGSCGAVFTYMP